MPLHITVVPASTQAGAETIRTLLKHESKPFVRGIYRNLSKAPVELKENPNFQAVQGDVTSGDGLDLNGSQAVFYIPPPTYDGTESGKFATQAATNVKKAIERAPSVKKLLLFSSIGSQYDHGIGVLRINHISDKILEKVVPDVLIVKPGYIFETWAGGFLDVKADPPVIHSPITPLDHKIPMVALKDVGECCANSLVTDSTKPSPHYFELFGPRNYSPVDMQKTAEEVLGKKVKLVGIEKDQLAALFAQEVPEVYVQDFVEMSTAVLPDGIMAGDFEYKEDTAKGRTELVETLREMYAK